MLEFTRDKQNLPIITLQVSKKLYPILLNKKFGFWIEHKNGEGNGSTNYVKEKEQGSEIWTREIKNENKKITFLIYTDFEYKNDPKNGNWYISSLWLNDDKDKNNLLKSNINFTS